MNMFILDGKTPVKADLETWSPWFVTANRQVAKSGSDKVLVSTVFLGLDHAWDGGLPLLFETMIFGGEHDQYQDRCSTWEEAEEMHREACALANIDILTGDFMIHAIPDEERRGNKY